MKNKPAQRAVGGASAKRLIYPIQIILTILHLIIIILIMSINRTSAELSATMQSAAMYTQDATALLGGSSLLADTSNNFVMRPVLGIGEVNTFPLFAYANELGNPRRGSDVMAKFRSYDVGDKVLRDMEEAAASADYLLQSQLHAISLVRSVYPLPDTPPLSAIPVVALAEEEQRMTGEEKVERARALLLSSEYSQHKQTVSQNVNSCAEQLRSDSAHHAAEVSRRISLLRQLLWAITGIVILILCITFITLHAALLTPLTNFVRLMPEDKPLDEGAGVHEVRLVASAYNEVLKRRDALDSILRSAAEKDALTGLANRYRFQQYCMEMEEEGGYPVAVLLFDINFLKRTNDTLGHSAGDKLIRTAAKCISDCFGDEEAGNCFRLGGDEFAAVVRDCTLWDVDAMTERFRLMEKEADVSVSLGVAYASDIGETTFRELMDEADGKMYEEKKIIHENAKAL